MCGGLFTARMEKESFCSPECSKLYRKKKAAESLPSFCCPFCRTLTKLDFDITAIENKGRWLRFKCPKCGKGNAGLKE